MNMIKQLFLGIALLACIGLSAQSPLKFGHVNSQAILTVMPELKTVDEQLQGEYSKLEAQLTDMQESLQQMQQDYVAKVQSGNITPDERANLETQLQEGNAKVQNFYQQSQSSLQQKEQELKQPIFDKLTKAIQEVGAENGFLYIFEEVGGLAVYKSEKSVDVSDLVKTKLGIQ